MDMPQGITVVTTWVLKPDLADTFVELLAGMLPDTRLHKGFRSTRLLPIAEAADQFLLLQEWDVAEDFHVYARFRNEAGGGEKLLAMTTSAPQTSLWLTEPGSRHKTSSWPLLVKAHWAERRNHQ